MTGAAMPRHFPRAPLIGAAALIGFTLLAAASVRLTGTASNEPASTPVAERDLRFEDRADGAVAIYDARDNKPVEILEGQNGFLRATMRGLAQVRRRAGAGDEAPFHLTAWQDGRVTLDDPVTGRHVELAAFGGTNEAVFARLLPSRAGAGR